jgi:hypothetical protein
MPHTIALKIINTDLCTVGRDDNQIEATLHQGPWNNVINHTKCLCRLATLTRRTGCQPWYGVLEIKEGPRPVWQQQFSWQLSDYIFQKKYYAKYHLKTHWLFFNKKCHCVLVSYCKIRIDILYKTKRMIFSLLFNLILLVNLFWLGLKILHPAFIKLV